MTVAVFLLPVVSLLVGLRAQAIGTWLRVIDHPDGYRKTHSAPMPMVGGIAISAPFLAYCVLQLWNSPGNAIYGALIIAVSGAFLLGYFDDRKPLSERFRFIGGIVLVLTSLGIEPTLVVEEFNFSFLPEVIALHPFSTIFTILVIVGMVHAVNMADGVNGLVCGLCFIWSAFMLYYAPMHIMPVLMLLIVCTFVTMVFNLKGRLFLGNSGAYALGITASILSAYIYNTTSGTLHADVVVAWFIVPVLDCLRLMVTRLCERRSPMSSDTNHLHHRLQRILPGWSVLLLYWMLVAVPGAIAIAMPSVTLDAVAGVTGIYLGLLVLTSEWFVVIKDKRQASRSLQ